MDAKTATKNLIRTNVPELRTGQVIRVHERIKEGDKERVQVFEGLVIAVKHGRALNGSYTVRKIGAGNVGVERTFPLYMPAIEKVEVLRAEKVHKSKLYFVRGQIGKKTKKRKTKLQSLLFDMGVKDVVEEPVEETIEEVVEETPENVTETPKEEVAEEVPSEPTDSTEPVAEESKEE